MASLEWSEKLENGLPRMDDTHREFVELYNVVANAGPDAFLAAYDAFVAHTEAHFAQENRWMEAVNFPGCHRVEHDRVLAVLHDIRKRVAAGDTFFAKRLVQELPAWFDHHTNGFEPSRTPGVFCPEDLRALALNHRAFPRFVYDLRHDLPAGYPLRPGPRWLPPMTIPGQATYRFAVSTTSGEAEGSRVANLAVGVIRPDRGPGITYDASTMWHSPTLPDGWATLEIRFAEPVTLDRLALHTEHSGLYHRAQAVTVEVATGRGWSAVTTQALRQADAEVRFAQATAATWRLRLQAGPTRMVVVRGLRWFWQQREVCPPLLAPEAFG